jgi:hypothetical protein
MLLQSAAFPYRAGNNISGLREDSVYIDSDPSRKSV